MGPVVPREADPDGKVRAPVDHEALIYVSLHAFPPLGVEAARSVTRGATLAYRLVGAGSCTSAERTARQAGYSFWVACMYEHACEHGWLRGRAGRVRGPACRQPGRWEVQELLCSDHHLAESLIAEAPRWYGWIRFELVGLSYAMVWAPQPHSSAHWRNGHAPTSCEPSGY